MYRNRKVVGVFWAWSRQKERKENKVLKGCVWACSLVGLRLVSAQQKKK